MAGERLVLRVGDDVGVALCLKGVARRVLTDRDDAVGRRLAVLLEGDDVPELHLCRIDRLHEDERSLVDARLHRAARDDVGAESEHADRGEGEAENEERGERDRRENVAGRLRHLRAPFVF